MSVYICGFADFLRRLWGNRARNHFRSAPNAKVTQGLRVFLFLLHSCFRLRRCSCPSRRQARPGIIGNQLQPRRRYYEPARMATANAAHKEQSAALDWRPGLNLCNNDRWNFKLKRCEKRKRRNYCDNKEHIHTEPARCIAFLRTKDQSFLSAEFNIGVPKGKTSV